MYLRTITAIVVSLAAATVTSSIPLNKRIVNGTPVKEDELPMFAQFEECGGTLIGPQTIEYNGNVYFGSVDRNKGKFNSVKFVIHPNRVHDIGLVFLPERVDGPYGIIEGKSYPEERSKWTVAGYGRTSADGPLSNILLKTQVTIGRETVCAANTGVFTPTTVCTIDNGHSACHGDSGGPLYRGSGKHVHVVALARSAGYLDRCGERGTFQYFVYIKPFLPWIKSEIELNEANSATEVDADSN
ncbi:hypothetical protein EC968_000882 [Mortierella alpina]|nr:hypothetical protein EC968_000882 [Mortierella alpina]